VPLLQRNVVTSRLATRDPLGSITIPLLSTRPVPLARRPVRWPGLAL